MNNEIYWNLNNDFWNNFLYHTHESKFSRTIAIDIQFYIDIGLENKITEMKL